MNISNLRIFLAALLLACGAVRVSAAEPGPLLQGVLGDEIAAVRAAIDHGLPVNAIDSVVGSTALHAAVAPGGPRDRSIAELLLSKGARPDLVDPGTGLTPLAAATVVTEQGAFASLERVRSANVAEVLLNGGADPNQVLAKGETPLMLAVSQNNLPVVKLLLARGANPNLRDANLSTALHVAYATNRSQEMIDALLAAGASPRLRDAQGLMPGEMPQPPAVQAVAANQPVAPAPADPVPEKPSSMNKWLVGGAVVATAVIGSVVLAHLVKEQKKKKAQQAGSNSATTAALTAALTTATGGGQASAPPSAPPPAPQPIPPASAPAPVPPVSTPQPLPGPTPLAGIFDGRYGSQNVLPDGFTHTERANVEGTTVALNHEFVSRDGTTTGSFRWSGVLRMLPGTPPRAEITGQGAINNQGVRNFTLESATVVITPAGDVQLCWKATDPKFGGIGGCTKRGFIPPAPTPGLPAPPAAPPQVTVPVAIFDGSYGSRVVSGDGFTHTEQAKVLGGKIELTHEFVSKDGAARGSFRWSGTLDVQPGTVPMARLKGSGTIDNVGQRSFTLEDGNIHRDANGTFKLSWKATDPKFGPIGGGAERGFAVAVPMPVPPAPVVTPPATPAPLVPREIVIDQVLVIPPRPIAGSEFMVRAILLNKTDADLTHTWTLTGPNGLKIGPDSIITRAGTGLHGTMDIRVTLPAAGSQVLTLQLEPVRESGAKTQNRQFSVDVQPAAKAEPAPPLAPATDFGGRYSKTYDVGNTRHFSGMTIDGNTVTAHLETSAMGPVPKDYPLRMHWNWTGVVKVTPFPWKATFEGNGSMEELREKPNGTMERIGEGKTFPFQIVDSDVYRRADGGYDIRWVASATNGRTTVGQATRTGALNEPPKSPY